MKKIIAIVSSFLFFTIVTAQAESQLGFGVTGAYHEVDGSGTETTRQSGQVNTGSHSETVFVPEIFVEILNDEGYALGLSYIPTRDMGSKSRSDTNSEGDTGTYKAAAELDNVIKLYTDVPMGSLAGSTPYFTLGLQHVTLSTLESLNSGSAYPNKDLWGYTIGLGAKGDLPYGTMYYKGEVSYTNFGTYEAVASGNTVKADLEDIAAKLSIGFKF